MAWCRAGLCSNVILSFLIAVAFVANGIHLFSQSKTATASLAVQVDPADHLTITGGTTVSLQIRLGTGPAYLWGDSLGDCATPIETATDISTSGTYTPLLTAVPFNTTSNDYVCVYDSGTPSLNTSQPWPHNGLNLAFTQQPTGAASGASISPAVTVQVNDSNGIRVASSTASVAVAITSGTGTSGAALSGTLTQTAVNGIATFSNLSINEDGTGYSLTATSTGISPGTSGTFNITSGAVSASTSTVSASPSSVVADGATISTITVTLKDGNSNPVSGKTVTLAAGSGSSTITTVNGTTNSSGQATFTLKDTVAQTVTYTATDASDNNLVIAQTAQVTFTAGAINHFAISAISSPQTAGTAFTITTITAQDVNNNTVTSFTSTVTYGGTAGVTGTSAAFTAGVLTNASVTPTVAGSNLTVIATNGSTTGTATIGTINPGALNHFAISAISSPKTAGTAFTISTITAQDANNNTVSSFTSTVTFSGSAGVIGTSATFSAGVLSNASVTPTVAGSNLTVIVTSGSATGTATITTINPGAANKLAITSVNGGSNPTAGTAFSVVVQAQDANGNAANVVASTGVTLSLNAGTGTLGGTLTGTITAGSNSATITGVTYTKAQSGVILTATRTSGDSLTAGNSAAFTVNPGTATKVVFTTQPGGGTGGTAWTTQPTVTVEDANGNTVTSSSASIQLAIATNPSSGTLTCTTNPQSATSGADTFAGCSINKTGTGFTLTATSSGLTSATSGTFNITLGPAAQLAFTVQPSATTVATNAFAAQPAVTVQDAGGNTVTTSTASITLAITSGTGATGAGLTCTANPKSASSGVDAFAGCKIDTGSNSTYTLTATSGGLSSAVSNPFTIQDFSLAVTSAISPNPTSHKSASATATITLTSIGSFTGSVAVSCTASGPNSSCTSPVTVPANGSVPTTLTLSTNGNSTGAGTYTITVTGTFGSLTRSVSPSPTWTLN